MTKFSTEQLLTAVYLRHHLLVLSQRESKRFTYSSYLVFAILEPTFSLFQMSPRRKMQYELSQTSGFWIRIAWHP